MKLRFFAAALMVWAGLSLMTPSALAEQLKEVRIRELAGKLYSPSDTVLSIETAGKAERYVLRSKTPDDANAEAKIIDSSIRPFEVQIGEKQGKPVYAQVYGDETASKHPSEALEGAYRALGTGLKGQSGIEAMQKCDGSWICVRRDKENERCLQWRCVGVTLKQER